MNVSSIVIKINLEKAELIMDQLDGLCEVHHCENAKLIATIEQDTIDDEIRIIRAIEKIDGVSSVEMAFSYSETELEKIRNDVELGGEVPKWLNDESVTAKQIDYQGDLKKKF
ncbi:MAG: chaperone NapD [Bacteroidetes bacterium]|nr:chaperone NapD [Bacteroidota bacterium]